MLDHWIQSAHERNGALRVDVARLLRAHDVVVSSVGVDWVRKQIAKFDSGGTVSDAHPLIRELVSPADTALISVAELGIYLESFKDDPAIGEVVKDLRSKKYESSFLELATAFRWRTAGADVRLQPATPKGVADFAARVGTEEYIVEASISAGDEFSEPGFRAGLVIDKAIKATTGYHFPVAVKARFQSPPTGDWEGILRNSVKKACTELRQRRADSAASSGVASVTVEDFTVEAEEITTGTEQIPFQKRNGSKGGAGGDWTAAHRISLASPPEGGPSYLAIEDPEKHEVARIFLKVPTVEGTENLYERILKKFTKEARQLRGIRQPRVVVLDVSGLEENALALNVNEIQAGFSKAMKDTPELACIWLVSRVWTTAMRYRYQGLYVSNETALFQLPDWFLRKLLEREHNWDLVGEQQLPHLGGDDAQKDYRERARW